MDYSTLPTIQGFTVTSLLLTAVICAVSVFVVWYNYRTQVHFSQMIAGAFGYLLYLLLSSLISGVVPGLSSGVGSVVSFVLIDVLIIEAIRILMTKYALIPRFQSADSAIGYALGFAGVYLIFSCAFYYFSCYTTLRAFSLSGDSFFTELSAAEAEAAYELITKIAGQSGITFLATAINRVFYLLRNVFLSVLVWYGLTDGEKRYWLAVAPLCHMIAILPDGLFLAGIIDNSLVSDISVSVLSFGIVLLGSMEYRSHENIIKNFKLERLATRRHK